MNEQNRNQIIALVVLAGLLAYAVYYSMSSMNSLTGGEGAQASADSSATGTPGGPEFKSVIEDVNQDHEALIREIEVVKFQYSELKAARDPSRPVNETDGMIFDPPFPPTGGPISRDSLIFIAERKVLTAILHGGASPLAVIDGDVVGIGEEYRETASADVIIIKDIGVDYVVFSIPSEDQEITKEIPGE